MTDFDDCGFGGITSPLSLLLSHAQKAKTTNSSKTDFLPDTSYPNLFIKPILILNVEPTVPYGRWQQNV